jgi:V/A-type H+-transporting ATPase subunit E
MELQIQDLVSSIRKEGIDAANAEAEAIIAEAKKKAESIVSDAKADAANIKSTAEKEINTMKENALISAEQARRDAVLSFKAEIKKEFEKILSSDVKKTLNAEFLGSLIKAALNGENAGEYAVETEDVCDALKAQLAQEIRQGLEIRPTKGVGAGFRLASKDNSGYFDCSDEEITQMLMPYLRNLDF